ncbi:hypothetical protein FB45DRAFT_878211 [Roridomyces roridus]|uniref:Uncharacterized protein n=1 Tax=Roridomyces roridus TaxID=1738132 RepID=A0AAD7F784_9AGAR|nr:hypothetical protein FB45DRAFT_878211 [Roridomyces roridus]
MALASNFIRADVLLTPNLDIRPDAILRGSSSYPVPTVERTHKIDIEGDVERALHLYLVNPVNLIFEDYHHEKCRLIYRTFDPGQPHQGLTRTVKALSSRLQAVFRLSPAAAILLPVTFILVLAVPSTQLFMPDCSFCCESFQGSKAGLTNHLKRCAAAAEEHLEALRDIAAEEQAANDAVAAREAEELAATARAQSSPPMDIDEPPAVS